LAKYSCVYHLEGLKWVTLILKSQQVGHTSEKHLNVAIKHEIELARISSLLLWTPKGLRAAWWSKRGKVSDAMVRTNVFSKN
jgi:hypothetical protein